MKITIALIMGVISGFMIYMTAAMLFVSDEPSGGFILVTFIGGWAASTYLMVKGARTASKVFARGFLIGAAEWLVVIPAGMVMAGKAVSDATSVSGGSETELAGAAIGGGLFAFLTGGVAIFMAVMCLICFAVAYFIGREMKSELAVPTKKCPTCAELIQEEAIKCRYCGATM